MVVALVVVGLVVGAISGFFGVGGGMILVPTLLALGIDIKSAIAISVVQMVFSSILGSYLNYKKGKLQVNEGIWVGVGGVLGGVIGAQFTDILPERVLEYLLLFLVTFALIRVITSKKPPQGQGKKSFSKLTLFFIGFFIGIIAIMLGVGGSIMLTPILVGFLHFSTKEAAVAGLFFVVFSSISGLFYKIFSGTFENLNLDFTLALSVAIASLVGVVIGIKLKDIIKDTHHKHSLIVLYLIILALLIKKIFIG
ncbi:MAG: sulfite exporter TauE/SafE family protein [Epsilonproteobacteria bacterium]|nr:sulfite exporter TauE/SafE family protein [Campylobacterota bacterium]